MAFKVRAQSDAKVDLLEAAAFIFDQEKSKAPVDRWLKEMKRAMDELKHSPLTFARIPEEFEGSDKLREIHLHSHRIIFRVDESRKLVSIVRIYHSSRKPLTPRHIKFE
jgi:plasmid stabilization system protein ParE